MLQNNFFNVLIEPRAAVDENSQKPDVRVCGLSVNMFVEFSLLQPLVKSNMEQHDPIHTREQQKLLKYNKYNQHGVSVGVVVFDVFGKLGKEGEKVMKTLARDVDDPLFLRHMYTCLSFAVQRGNGRMMEAACARCKLPSVPVAR